MADRWLLDSTRRAKAALIDTAMPNWARVGGALFWRPGQLEADRKAVRMLAAAAPVMAPSPPRLAPSASAWSVTWWQRLGSGSSSTSAPASPCRATPMRSRSRWRRTAASCTSTTTRWCSRTLARSWPPRPTARWRAGREPERPCRHSRRRGRDPGPWQAGRDPADGHAVVRARRRNGVQDRAVTGRGRDGRQPCRALPSGERPGSGDVRGGRAVERDVRPPRHPPLRAQLTGLLSGLNPVPPGLVPVTEWRPAPHDPRFERLVPVYGAVARKP